MPDHGEVVACVVCSNAVKFLGYAIFVNDFEYYRSEIDTCMTFFEGFERQKWLVKIEKFINVMRGNTWIISRSSQNVNVT